MPHYSFFQHTQCEYFPCHATDKPDSFNCLFCYCPLYHLGTTCGGSFTYDNKGVKRCESCLYPHKRENYDGIIEKLKMGRSSMNDHMIFRKLSVEDIDRLVSMRIDQLREEGAKSDFDLRPSLIDYYNKHLPDGSFISYIAEIDGKIVAASGLSFAHKPPYFSNPSGKIGIISSMYTRPEHRRKGIAKRLFVHAHG